MQYLGHKKRNCTTGAIPFSIIKKVSLLSFNVWVNNAQGLGKMCGGAGQAKPKELAVRLVYNNSYHGSRPNKAPEPIFTNRFIFHVTIFCAKIRLALI